MQPRKKLDEDWVARILEIRASDGHHVYARVAWMYFPDELPQGTYDGKKIVQGRQSYHGTNELIASNHMDIINAVSVTAQATVRQWYEENDDEVQQALYWRKAFDVRTYELSTVKLVCSCNTSAHPDHLLVGCTAETCKKWMHEQCIKDEALRNTYSRLGTDTAAQIPKSQGPRRSQAAAKPDRDGRSRVGATSNSKTQPADATGKAKLGRPKKNVLDANGISAKVWEALFEATHKVKEESPPVLEFNDLVHRVTRRSEPNPRVSPCHRDLGHDSRSSGR
ncbi:hypothetical protein QBC47DRAFT_35112 [Echria macrotheca]|uniref:BAH domain-containing protein n=1 Tax=Echria macrotheca TaxID=438768 RepID=A0AAJ0BBP0_9PEZI|nr:hypothetical protein QBC47DRAFT_35112 [Echria macrotheca]